jgi:hypothetical protein
VNRTAAVLIGLLLLLGGCAPAASPSASPSPTAEGPFPASPVVGVVTGVDSEGLNAVHGFSLRTEAGVALEIEIGDLENAAEFPPAHLQEHLATASPVRVFFRVDGVRLVAYRIEDAD